MAMSAWHLSSWMYVFGTAVEDCKVCVGEMPWNVQKVGSKGNTFMDADIDMYAAVRSDKAPGEAAVDAKSADISSFRKQLIDVRAWWQRPGGHYCRSTIGCGEEMAMELHVDL